MLLHHLLERAARLYPERTAVRDGSVVRSYATVHARTRRLAAALQARGLAPGERVAVLAHNDHRYLEAYFAASLAGLVLVPVNFRLAPREVAFLLADSGARALLVAPALLPLLDEVPADAPLRQHLVLLDADGSAAAEATEMAEAAATPPRCAPPQDALDYEALLAAAAPEALRVPAPPETGMAHLCYTGGTTGTPKGVMLSHRNVVASAIHKILLGAFTGADVWLHVTPLFHQADSWAVFTFTALGATHVFTPRFDADAVLRLIPAHGVTGLQLVPTMIVALLEAAREQRPALGSLRRVLYGSSSLPVDRLQAAADLFGPVLQQVFGQTEAAGTMTATAVQDPAAAVSEADVARLASCGREVLGVEVRITDGEGHEQPPGTVGAIRVRGPNVMLGYWNRPAETAAALREGWLDTGDLGYLDAERHLFIVDRAKDMIISGGENVYSAEVENALSAHPAVLECAVVGVPHPHWGEAVHAAVVLRPDITATAEALIAHCRTRIAAYKCPKAVHLVRALPKSGAGKILKSRLREAYAAGSLTDDAT